MYFIRTLSLFIGLAIIIGCNEDVFYDRFIEIENGVWEIGQEQKFDVDIRDTTAVYGMALDIEHSKDYSYENIYLRITTVFPEREPRSETLNVQLAEKSGQWIGKCSSNKCLTKVYLLDRFRFPQPGVYGFIFEQYTRNEQLEGIHSIRLKINKNVNKNESI